MLACCRDVQGQTALYVAVNELMAGNRTPRNVGRCGGCGGSNLLNLVQWLLAAGARVDVTANDGTTAMHTAAARGCEAAFRLLLAGGGAAAAAVARTAGGNATAAHFAAAHGEAGVIRALLAACGGAAAAASDGCGDKAAATAAAQPLLAGVSVRMVMEAVNAAGQSPLHVAAAGNHVDTIKVGVKEHEFLHSTKAGTSTASG
jgi:ankyrin repeat protein